MSDPKARTRREDQSITFRQAVLAVLPLVASIVVPVAYFLLLRGSVMAESMGHAYWVIGIGLCPLAGAITNRIVSGLWQRGDRRSG